MYRYFLTAILLLITAFVVNAQVLDTTVKKNAVDAELQSKRDLIKANPIVPKVKEKVYHPDSNHKPGKAVLHSLMIPGWGQAYNRRWWKVPVIYTGLGLIAWAYLFNKQYYNETLAVSRYRDLGVEPLPGDKYYQVYNDYRPYQTQTIKDAVLVARRNRDLSVLGFVGAWGIQIIDAYIDAKFIHSYTMDDKLSFKVKPTLMGPSMYAGNFNGSVIPGLKITFAFN
jgi:hypothetical protein